MVYQLDAERKLSSPELSALAERLVNSQDPIEASRVRETIVRGFYGAEERSTRTTKTSRANASSQ